MRLMSSKLDSDALQVGYNNAIVNPLSLTKVRKSLTEHNAEMTKFADGGKGREEEREEGVKRAK